MPGGGTIEEVRTGKGTKREPKGNRGSHWDEIRREYVQGILTPKGLHYPSLSELAQRHGVSVSAIKKRAWKEKWAEERKKWKARLEEKIQEKRSEEIAREIVQLERKVVSIATISLNVAERKAKEYEERGNVSEYKFARLMEGVRTIYDTARTALGEAPELRVSVEYVAEFEGLNDETEDEAED